MVFLVMWCSMAVPQLMAETACLDLVVMPKFWQWPRTKMAAGAGLSQILLGCVLNRTSLNGGRRDSSA